MMRKFLNTRTAGGWAGAALSLLLASSSCSNESLTAERVVAIASFPEAVTVAASSETEGKPLTDTLVIRANRAWTARLVEPLGGTEQVGWVSLSDNEACSVTGRSFDTLLVLTFAENGDGKPRCCELEIHSGGGKLTVPVRQASRQ